MKPTRATSSKPADVERQLKSFIAKFDPAHQTLIRSVRRTLRRQFPTVTNWPTTITTSSSSVTARRSGPPTALCRWRLAQTESGYALFMVPACLIQTSSSLALVIRRASFGLSQRMCWAVQKLRRSLLRQFLRPKHLFVPAGAANSSFDRCQRSSDRVESRQSN